MLRGGHEPVLPPDWGRGSQLLPFCPPLGIKAVGGGLLPYLRPAGLSRARNASGVSLPHVPLTKNLPVPLAGGQPPWAMVQSNKRGPGHGGCLARDAGSAMGHRAPASFFLVLNSSENTQVRRLAGPGRAASATHPHYALPGRWWELCKAGAGPCPPSPTGALLW